MDSVLDVFQGFVANPEPYMEALGLRVKRQAEDFTVFPIPYIGEVGVKYLDTSNVIKGGEAYVQVEDLKSLVPFARSKLAKVNVKFDGGLSSQDSLFNCEVAYHLEHADGQGTEEGTLRIERQFRDGKWRPNVKTES